MKLAPLLLLLFAGSAVPHTSQAGMYASSATPIWDLLWDASGKDRPVKIPSPDHSAALTANWAGHGIDSGVQLTLQGRGATAWSERVTPGVGMEAAWAPDSKAFFVTTSGGGRNGFYALYVYFANESVIKKVDLTPTIEAAFGHPVKCQTQEPPNVAGVSWLPNSDGLIAVAEVVNHSNCDSAGTFRAYRISLPGGRIVGSYDQIEAKRLFAGDLGWEIENAPDRCIRRPSSCWLESNHRSAR